MKRTFAAAAVASAAAVCVALLPRTISPQFFSPFVEPTALAQAVSARAGTIAVTIREWDVPTAGSNSQDAAVGLDGALWWSEQAASKLGELDPQTGIRREFQLKNADSGPRGIAVDREGAVWFAGNDASLIGKLDPRSGAVTEYRMPNVSAEDPYALAFDARGMLWFTVQGGNFVGRLDPRSGKIDLKRVPTEDALPFDIVVTKQGVPIFSEFGANKLGKIDPQTMAITEYTLPGSGTRPRRLAAADGSVYFTDWAEGHLGRFDPATGAAKLWPSPGGAESNPFGIAVTPDGTVWYSEAGVLPENTIVRFDPKTETFAVAAIPNGGGIVRNMAATPEGRIYFVCSALNKVGVALANQARVRPTP